jgi:hypothetical protein
MLLEQQTRLSQALVSGDWGAALDLCEGDAARIALGLRVYANNLAHAMVSAARDSFPQTAQRLGETRFTVLALAYARTQALPAAVIGEALSGFASFLATQSDIDTRAAACARFESLWLESYHAADATPLTGAALATLDGETFAEATLVFHPSLRLFKPDADMAAAQPAQDALAFLAEPCALLRPATVVKRVAINETSLAAIEGLMRGLTLGRVLETAEAGETLLGDLAALINAGAVARIFHPSAD